MASPKNWRRQTEEETRLDHVEMQWINEALPVHRTLRVEKFPNKPYRVNYSEEYDPIAVTDSREEARRMAVEWLRNHPAPDVPESVRQEALH